MKDKPKPTEITVNSINAIKAALQKYNSFGCEWEKTFFDDLSGGYVVVNKQRIEHSKRSKNEKAKFDKEFEMSLVFAKNGCKIELLEEIPRISSPDVRINGILADLKRVSSHNNIVKEAKKAVNNQGAKIVLFEFETENDKIHKEILKLQNVGIHGKYYFTKKYLIHDF